MKRVFVLSMVAAAGFARADVTQNQAEFLSANPGLALIDFEGIAPPSDFVTFDFTPQGVTFANGGPLDDPVVVSATVTSDLFGISPAPSDYILQGFDDTPLGFSFTGDATAVGFNVSVFSFGNDFTPFDVIIEAFDGNTLLDSIRITTEQIGSFGSFVGFSGFGTNITSVQLSHTELAGRVIAIDNLSFGVPVPAPAATGLFALTACAALRRRAR